MSSDQAAGLRDWAKQQQHTPTPEQTLVIVGLPSQYDGSTDAVRAQLHHLAERGKQWVGDAEQWQLIAADIASSSYADLLATYPRWALWVEPDSNGFQRAYYALRKLNVNGGPKRLLLLHPPVVSTRGLINNVRESARQFFNIELISVRVSSVSDKE
ncbi:MAG: hypothetical protein LAT53_07755 [Idiomarina sp.]|nr:hypothetical protein [Idiomarina sp.]